MYLPRRDVFVLIDKGKTKGAKDASLITTLTKDYVISKTSVFSTNNGRVRDYINILMKTSRQIPTVEIVYEGGNAGGLAGAVILNGVADGVIYDGLKS